MSDYDLLDETCGNCFKLFSDCMCCECGDEGEETDQGIMCDECYEFQMDELGE